MLGPNCHWAWSGAEPPSIAALTIHRGAKGRAKPGSTHLADRVNATSFARLLCEQDAAGLDFLLREDVDDTVLERHQVLEHAGQGIRFLPLEILEILEIVLVEEDPGLAVVD